MLTENYIDFLITCYQNFIDENGLKECFRIVDNAKFNNMEMFTEIEKLTKTTIGCFLDINKYSIWGGYTYDAIIDFLGLNDTRLDREVFKKIFGKLNLCYSDIFCVSYEYRDVDNSDSKCYYNPGNSVEHFIHRVIYPSIRKAYDEYCQEFIDFYNNNTEYCLSQLGNIKNVYGSERYLYDFYCNRFGIYPFVDFRESYWFSYEADYEKISQLFDEWHLEKNHYMYKNNVCYINYYAMFKFNKNITE